MSERCSFDTHRDMPSEYFESTDACEQALDVFKQGRDADRPWGAHFRYLLSQIGMDKSNVEYQLCSRVARAGNKISRAFSLSSLKICESDR